MSRLRAAIVGAGLMGRWHAHAAERAGASVAAVVDRDTTRAATLAQSHKARAATSLNEVLDAVDVVHVCTPTTSHAALVREAIAAGHHVFCEKPLAASAADTAQLLDLASERGVLLCPVHQFAWQRGVLDMIDALPQLGVVRHIDFVICSAGASAPQGPGPDDVAIEILPHPLSVLAKILPASVPSDWLVRRTAPGEYRLLTDAAHTSVSILVSMSGRPTVNALRVIAEGGTAHVNLFHGYAVIEDGSVSRRRKITQPFELALATGARAAVNLADRAVRREPAYPGLVELTTRFYAAIEHRGDPPIVPQETLAIAKAIDAIRSQAVITT